MSLVAYLSSERKGEHMYDTAITMCGNVITAPEWRRTSNTGTYVMTFRFASTSRKLDRGTNQWIDGDSLRVKVACWRTLGQNAFESIQLGDPLIIYGRLYSRDWVDSDQKRRTSYELDAISVGHDISRGVSKFARRKPAGAVDSIDDAEARSAIGGERSELVEAPSRPAGMPAVSELFAGFDPERFDTEPVFPEGYEIENRLGGDDGDTDDDAADDDDGDDSESAGIDAEMAVAA
jgi:single-strand DNA-binding protein